MPAKTDPTKVIAKMMWIKDLPDEGALWGKALISTGESIVGEIKSLEEEKASLAKQINDRMRVLRTLPRRARREAPLMFGEDVVSSVMPDEEDK